MKNSSFREIAKTSLESSNIVFTGIAFDDNASLGKGSAKAPSFIRECSANIPGVTREGKLLSQVKLHDAGDFIRERSESIQNFFDRISSEVEQYFAPTRLSVFIGGDHSVNIPTFKAFINYTKKVNKTPVLIHIDAHPDMMDVYADNNLSHATPARRALDNGLKEENLVFIGLRGFEAYEVEYFATHPAIKIYTASKVHKMGVKKIINETIKKYKSEQYAIYVSYDIDANDPSFAPGTGTPEAFGLRSSDTLSLVEAFTALNNTYALDIVEVSPPLDINNVTTWLALKTLYEVFYIRGNR